MSASAHATGGRSAASRRPRRVTGRHRTVRARFELREIPGVTVHGVRDAASRAPVTGGPAPVTDAPDPVTDGPDPVADGPDPVADAWAPVADAARLAAQRALAEAGRGYLGGCLELRAPGRVRAARDRRALRRAAGRAAALAVAATLRGDDTGVHVRVTRR
ncbi:hypothetical protein ACFZAT_10560 [Streptomyces sp. NPDC008163]|uniref:hypothetical protein n=1 Tax=Streptomyces sp. NPDC008163 TaxID=3364818 RepID=UPI0036EDB18F